MELIESLAFLFSLTGVMLTTRGFGTLKTIDKKLRAKVEYSKVNDESTTPTFPSKGKDTIIDEYHENFASRFGSIFVLFSIFIRQIPFSGEVRFKFSYVIIMVIFISCLSTWLISKFLTKKAKRRFKREYQVGE